ncbi:MAG TPA: hypothetical protein VFI34_04085 [Candidatus Limnocylindrales bacterium]|nr:hypothetical protein [Candidatus Limnocylindrales bacterium]
MDPIQMVELPAGPDQAIVVYEPLDSGQELDPRAIFGAVADDAGRRAAGGEWIVSMTVMPLRHAGAMFSEASGYQTKTAVAIVYGRVGQATRTTDR